MGSPVLRPLEQWVCDTCGQVIESPAAGYVEWLSEGGLESCYDFRIVHQFAHSPQRETDPAGCYAHDRDALRQDLSAEDFVGPAGLVLLLSLIDVGPLLRPDYTGHEVKNLREWVELTRRLQLPYYEEARLYWDRAEKDGYFSDTNEIWLYLPDTLQRLIERYGD